MYALICIFFLNALIVLMITTWSDHPYIQASGACIPNVIPYSKVRCLQGSVGVQSCYQRVREWVWSLSQDDSLCLQGAGQGLEKFAERQSRGKYRFFMASALNPYRECQIKLYLSSGVLDIQVCMNENPGNGAQIKPPNFLVQLYVF